LREKDTPQARSASADVWVVDRLRRAALLERERDTATATCFCVWVVGNDERSLDELGRVVDLFRVGTWVGEYVDGRVGGRVMALESGA
jgi:hypothetical protein